MTEPRPHTTPINVTIPPPVAAPGEPGGNTGLQPSEGATSRRAVKLLLSKNIGFREPSRSERAAMLVGFAMRGKLLYGAAYDMVRLSGAVDLSIAQSIADNLDAITVYEIKSTNRPAVGPDLKGYFFNLTTAELLVAQSLGEQFRFAFVNVVTGEFQDLMLADVYHRARAIYPAWHIRF
jgi:hypothetical protein